jgi:hypothetical protein
VQPLRFVFLAGLLVACRPDPLADFRNTCRGLEEQKLLRAGLSVDRCAQQLKERADLDDPALKAEELVGRVTRLVGRGGAQELRDTLSQLQGLGRPAVAPALATLKSARDPGLRLALARVLINLCAEDCATHRFECMVPALLEGTSDDKPHGARIEAEKALTRCTGEELGDDPAAWRKWWAGKEKELQAQR